MESGSPSTIVCYASRKSWVTGPGTQDLELFKGLPSRRCGRIVALLLISDLARQIRLEGIAIYRIGGEKACPETFSPCNGFGAWRELREIAAGAAQG